MTPERWNEIKTILGQLEELDPEERRAYVENVCAQDAALREEIFTLMEAEDEEGPLDRFAEALRGPLGAPEKGLAPATGQMIQHYQIVGKIGSGGMGVVYEAKDTRLGRRTALKFLPQTISSDEVGRKRFLREARSAAAIDHPYICKIYEIGEANGESFIAMEYVRGQTLQEKLSEGLLPLEQSLRYATEIAEALEEAHRQGIVHRDLKPSNIMMTPGGHIKVMDFGLAKLLATGESSTGPKDHYTGLTGTGMRLGTVPYMSPEQLKSEKLDTRSDVFSFGTLLYEMLTGVHPFRRADAIETARAILKEDPPPLGGYASGFSELLSYLIRKMLAKDARRRYQSALEIRTDLEELIKLTTSRDQRQLRFGSVWKSPLLWSALLVVALAGVLAVLLIPAPEVTPVSRFELGMPSGERLAHYYRNGLAVAPDGRSLAFTGGVVSNPYLFPDQVRIYLRHLNAWHARPIPGTENAAQPFFSPDGNWLGFSQYEKERDLWFLKKVRISDGQVVTLCQCEAKWGATWGPADTIVFGSDSAALYRMTASGGTPTPLTTLDSENGEFSHRLPHFLPNGKAVLFTSPFNRDPLDNMAQIFAFSLQTGERKWIVNGWDARYIPSGHVVFTRDGNLVAAGFDPIRLEITGVEMPALERVSQSLFAVNPGLRTGTAQFSFSNSGLLAYAEGSVFPELKGPAVWVDREGREEPLDVEPRNYLTARLNRDGTQVLLTTIYPPQDVWLYDVGRKTARRQTFEGNGIFAVWGPSPEQLTFSSDITGERSLFMKQLDSGPGETRLLPGSEAAGYRPNAWSPDGRHLTFVAAHPETRFDIGILRPDGEIEWFLRTQFSEQYPEFSPDGRWIVYTSDESGRHEAYVRSYPDTGRAVQISTQGGLEPTWSHDGTEIFYRWRQEFFAVKLRRGGERLIPSSPEKLFEGNYGSVYAVRSFDLASDGRFLLIKRPDEAAIQKVIDEFFPARIRVIQNWFSEVDKRAPESF